MEAQEVSPLVPPTFIRDTPSSRPSVLAALSQGPAEGGEKHGVEARWPSSWARSLVLAVAEGVFATIRTEHGGSGQRCQGRRPGASKGNDGINPYPRAGCSCDSDRPHCLLMCVSIRSSEVRSW